jgi:short-subunit dehydrogenase
MSNIIPNQQQQRVIVVAGASRGIGRATAQALATSGTHLALAARSAADLVQLPSRSPATRQTKPLCNG